MKVSRDAAPCHGRGPCVCPPVTRRRPSALCSDGDYSTTPPSSSAPSTSSSSSVPDLAGDRIDHPLACDMSPHWPRDRPDPPFARATAGSREDRHRVRTPTTDRATGCRCAAPSGRSAAAFGARYRLPTRLPGVYAAGSLSPLHQLAPCSYAAPSCRSVAARDHLRRTRAPMSLASTAPTPRRGNATIRARSSSRPRVPLRLHRVPPPHLHR